MKFQPRSGWTAGAHPAIEITVVRVARLHTLIDTDNSEPDRKQKAEKTERRNQSPRPRTERLKT